MTDEYDPYSPEKGHFERAYNFIAFDEDSIGFEESSRLFNDWLNAQLADAWDKGRKGGLYDGRAQNVVMFLDRPNPYRKADS